MDTSLTTAPVACQSSVTASVIVVSVIMASVIMTSVIMTFVITAPILIVPALVMPSVFFLVTYKKKKTPRIRRLERSRGNSIQEANSEIVHSVWSLPFNNEQRTCQQRDIGSA